MKRLIALVAVMAVTSVNAEELKFGDLNYFLKQGQSNATLDFDQVIEKVTIKGGETTERRGYEVLARYGYAINDQLNVYVGVDYGYKNKFEVKSPTEGASYNNDGLSNPLLAANYRLLNQNSSAVNFDLGVVARFNVQDAERGSADTTIGGSVDGNFTDPRSSYEVNARIGHKWNEANEWQAAIGGIMHTSGDYDQENKNAASEEIEVDSSMDIYARVSYQYRPVNEFMMHLFVKATQVGEVEEDNKGSNTKSEADSRLDWSFGFQAKYLVTDAFIVRFNLTDALLPDYDVKSGATTQEVHKRLHSTYGLAVEYLF